MTIDRTIEARFERERAKRAVAVPTADDALTPQQKLVRAAETGRLEAIVAAAQPAEPPKMVTPEEREAELRKSGQWPAEKRKPRRAAKAKPKPPAHEPGQPAPEPTPNQQYVDEHCKWVPRRTSLYPRHRPGRCLTEYNVLTGEIIGDGYRHDEDEDEDW